MKRAASLAFALVLVSGVAAAQNDKALAKEAYDRGTSAQARGDFKHAAEEFARADALAPSPVALQAALDAAVDADDPVLGAELLERSKRAKPTGALATSIDAAQKKLGGRAGRVRVTCPSGARCSSKLDGAVFDSAKGVWIRTGPHTLVVDVDGSLDTRTVEVHAGEDFEIVPAPRGTVTTGPTPPNAPPSASATPATGTSMAPATPPPANAANAKPLPPIVFYVGAGLTVVLGGVATAYGLSAKGHHDDFVGAKCDVAATNPSCTGFKNDGESSQHGANIAFAATAVAGVATAVIGLFFTDWAHAAATGRAPVLVPVPGGIAGGYSARF